VLSGTSKKLLLFFIPKIALLEYISSNTIVLLNPERLIEGHSSIACGSTHNVNVERIPPRTTIGAPRDDWCECSSGQCLFSLVLLAVIAAPDSFSMLLLQLYTPLSNDVILHEITYVLFERNDDTRSSILFLLAEERERERDRKGLLQQHDRVSYDVPHEMQMSFGVFYFRLRDDFHFR
jgi:hypothetical protein